MIKYNKTTKTFHLAASNYSYCFFVNEFGYLQHLYFGKRIGEDDLRYLDVRVDRGFVSNFHGANTRMDSLELMKLEYPFFGTGDYRHPALSAIDESGNHVHSLSYRSHRIHKNKPNLCGMPSLEGGETLEVVLSSPLLCVSLFYTVYDSENALTRSATITNCSEQKIMLERAASMVLDLDGMDYELMSLWGKHNGERHIQRKALMHGKQGIHSTRGASSHQHNPFIAVCRPSTQEHSGEAIGINYVYGGNFCMDVECDYINNSRIFVGFNEFCFSWQLLCGESFCTPESVIVYSSEGLGQMSRSFHDLYRRYLINKRFVNKQRPIVINNWEATYFDFDEEKLFNLIDSAAGLGIDTFVLDDGWFGKRNSDTTSLGDWTVNTQKLSGGLGSIIKRCKQNGMEFGLWFEPEMISKDSELFRTHPSWRISAPNIEPASAREQYVLDLANDEVVEYLMHTISDILQNNDISYVKWDFNRHITDAYSATLPPSRQGEFYHRYMLGFYKLAKYLTERFSNVLFEGCSGGGGRFDPSNLAFFPQYWTSDNSDAFARTFIQYGTSMCYPLSSMSGHVSVCPNHQTYRTTPLKSRAAIASLCSFGYELDITKLSTQQRQQIKEQTSLYKELSPLIVEGDLYRLASPFSDNAFAFMVVSKSKDKALLTFMNALYQNNAPIHIVKLVGLDENKMYNIKNTPLTLSGKTLVNCGLPLTDFEGDFDTISLVFEEVK